MIISGTRHVSRTSAPHARYRRFLSRQTRTSSRNRPSHNTANAEAGAGVFAATIFAFNAAGLTMTGRFGSLNSAGMRTSS